MLAGLGLKTVGRLNSGDTILLTAATGGVGFAAIEIAKVSDAHRALESNKQVGKIVLTVN